MLSATAARLKIFFLKLSAFFYKILKIERRDHEKY